MRISDNGVIRDMTPEEEAEYNAMLAAQPAPEPTAEERLEALEAAIKYREAVRAALNA